MKVQCATCKHFSLQGSALAKHGFGLCTGIKREYITNPSATYQRICPEFSSTTGDALADRISWLTRFGAKQ